MVEKKNDMSKEYEEKERRQEGEWENDAVDENENEKNENEDMEIKGIELAWTTRETSDVRTELVARASTTSTVRNEQLDVLGIGKLYVYTILKKILI